VLFGVLMIPALLTTLFMREPPVPLRTQLQAGRYSFVHQLASVFVLIVLLVSVPAMFTQLYNTDFASVLFGRAARPAARRPRLPARHPLYP
jgi:PAT family beta-lactamase induction signal transducer AmpG